ncbi:hypothetical protein NKH77_02120 [Streptomyces sp. M19]
MKIRGYRIEPGEVERVLERHPAVRRAVVLADGGSGGGAEGGRLLCYAVTTGDPDPPSCARTPVRSCPRTWCPRSCCRWPRSR